MSNKDDLLKNYIESQKRQREIIEESKKRRDENNNQNGAIRVMRLKSVFQDSLSTHFGVVKTNINDIHTKKDLQKLRSKENVL